MTGDAKWCRRANEPSCGISTLLSSLLACGQFAGRKEGLPIVAASFKKRLRHRGLPSSAAAPVQMKHGLSARLYAPSARHLTVQGNSQRPKLSRSDSSRVCQRWEAPALEGAVCLTAEKQDRPQFRDGRSQKRGTPMRMQSAMDTWGRSAWY